LIDHLNDIEALLHHAMLSFQNISDIITGTAIVLEFAREIKDNPKRLIPGRE